MWPCFKTRKRQFDKLYWDEVRQGFHFDPLTGQIPVFSKECRLNCSHTQRRFRQAFEVPTPLESNHRRFIARLRTSVLQVNCQIQLDRTRLEVVNGRGCPQARKFRETIGVVIYSESIDVDLPTFCVG